MREQDLANSEENRGTVEEINEKFADQVNSTNHSSDVLANECLCCCQAYFFLFQVLITPDDDEQ